MTGVSHDARSAMTASSTARSARVSQATTAEG